MAEALQYFYYVMITIIFIFIIIRLVTLSIPLTMANKQTQPQRSEVGAQSPSKTLKPQKIEVRGGGTRKLDNQCRTLESLHLEPLVSLHQETLTSLPGNLS